MKTQLLCIWLFCVFVLIPDAWCADKEIAGCVLVKGGKLLPESSLLGAAPVDSFYIGKTEVTWGEWKTVRTWAVANGYTDLANVGQGVGEKYPVTRVNWYDVVKWCNARSEKEGKTPVYKSGAPVYRTGEVRDPQVVSSANGYRLPSSKEWEFAARGGTQTNGYTYYSGSNDLDAVGWYDGNSGKRLQPVGELLANQLGIFDLSGNAAEWTGSWSPRYAGYRVTRGGGCTYNRAGCEIAWRDCSYPPDFYPAGFIGFRVALSAAP